MDRHIGLLESWIDRLKNRAETVPDFTIGSRKVPRISRRKTVSLDACLPDAAEADAKKCKVPRKNVKRG